MNAAYGLIWTKVKGRDWLFIAIFALQIVPLQLAVLLNLFTNGWHLGSTTVIPDFGIGGHAAAIWIAHSCSPAASRADRALNPQTLAAARLGRLASNAVVHRVAFVA